jgi:hypothetical protein
MQLCNNATISAAPNLHSRPSGAFADCYLRSPALLDFQRVLPPSHPCAMRGDDMSVNTIDLLVRLPKVAVEQLRARKERTHEPTSSFIRRTVEAALELEQKVEQPK